MIISCQDNLYIGRAPANKLLTTKPTSVIKRHHELGIINDFSYDPENRYIYTAWGASGNFTSIARLNLDGTSAEEDESLCKYKPM